MNNQEWPLREKSIVFIGFMGVGKTTIGKLVAEKLCRDFIDTDEEIEKEFAMPATKIFETFGERTFREKEESLIVGLSQQPLKVLSLGGGAFLNENIRKACLKNGFVIFLDLSFENWKERIGLLIDSRPILQNKSLEQIEDLLTFTLANNVENLTFTGGGNFTGNGNGSANVITGGLATIRSMATAATTRLSAASATTP